MSIPRSVESVADVESAEQVSEPDNGADRRADLRALVTIFCATVLSAVHFISGWTFDF
jgi:hypothetical protein